MRALMFCAVNDGRTVQKALIAKACNASENHLAQIVQALGRMGYLNTHRGRGGGLQLARSAKDISIGEVFRDLEAALPFAECYDQERNTCPLIGRCRLRTAFDKALAVFYAELESISLEDLVHDNTPLAEILSLTDPLSLTCNAPL